LPGMSTWWRDVLSMVLPTVPILAVFGNALVMIAVWKERSLQTVTNLLIVSLAVSDLLVALFVMSFGIYFQVNDFKWGLGPFVCNLYLASDVMCSTASILNLLAISLDRFMAISHPIVYAQHGMRSSRALIMISIVWGLSIAIGLPILFGMNQAPSREGESCELANAYFNIGSSLLSFFIPCAGMIVLYTVIFKRLKQRERARSQRKATKMENERISSALLGGARFASQMGRHFKNRTDQILLEISFQTSSFPTLSESSDDRTTSSLNGGLRLTPPLQLPAVTVPVPSPVSLVGEDVDDACEVLLKKNAPDDRKGSDPSTIPVHEEDEEQPIDHDDLSSDRIDFSDVYRSFGEHLQELFPFIDSLSRRSSQSPDADDDEGLVMFAGRGDDGRRRKESKRHRMNTLHDDASDNSRPLVESAKSTPMKRSYSKRNGSLPHRGATASLQNCSLEEARMPLKLVPMPKSSTIGLEVPKVHRTAGTSSSTPVDNHKEEYIQTKVPMLEEYSHKSDEDCSKTKSIKKYRDELWKRVTSGWKARPSRQLVKKATKQMRREHKATVTLAVVLAVFLAFWLPFFTLHFTNSWCILLAKDEDQDKGCISNLLLSITTWLGYINSSLNPLIYTVFDQRFRNAFKRIICCSSRRR
ncbi:hypothetical protein PENTCL1PPCAC_29217, partial [Pristionchus entomophagus]